MAQLTYDLNPVSRITSGAVGPPGQREFYLQARQGSVLVSVLLEKEQVAALAASIEELLEQMEEEEEPFSEHEEMEDDEVTGSMELEEPISPEFRVGRMGIGYDEEHKLCVIVAQELSEDEEMARVVRFWGTRSQMRALSERSSELVAAGRPTCPLCGEPMNPDGHFCPNRNGHHGSETLT